MNCRPAPSDALKMDAAGRRAGRVLAVRAGLVSRQAAGFGWPPVGADEAVGAFDFFVADLQLCRVEIEQGQRLLEHEEVFLPPGAGESQRHFVRAFLAAEVPQGGQLARVALASG